jgi:hypothetical protein
MEKLSGGYEFKGRPSTLKGLTHEMEFDFFDKNEYVLGLNKNLYWLLNYC